MNYYHLSQYITFTLYSIISIFTFRVNTLIEKKKINSDNQIMFITTIKGSWLRDSSDNKTVMLEMLYS